VEETLFVMKIGVINCKVGEDHNVQDYLDFLRGSAARLSSGLLVGPDYALADRFDMATPEKATHILEQLKELAKGYPALTFVPGTMPMQVDGAQMAHRAFVFNQGRVLHFDKQTDCGEEALAERYKLRYKRGASQSNTFYFGDRKVGIHICGDRDRKPESISEDSDIELILAHDRNAGFHRGVFTPDNPRYIVLSDSFHPMAEVIHYPEVTKFLKAEEVYDERSKSLKIFKI